MGKNYVVSRLRARIQWIQLWGGSEFLHVKTKNLRPLRRAHWYLHVQAVQKAAIGDRIIIHLCAFIFSTCIFHTLFTFSCFYRQRS